MKKIFSEVLAVLLVLLVAFTLSACGVESETGIYGLRIDSLSNKEFYSGIVYEDFKLKVDNLKEYEASDINVVIADSSIFDIAFEKKKSLL